MQVNSDGRSEARQRLYKGGEVSYSARQVTLPCVIRNISSSGARLQVKHIDRVPDTFELLIELDGFEAECKTVWRNADQVGVQFMAAPSHVAPRRAQIVSATAPTAKPSLRRRTLCAEATVAEAAQFRDAEVGQSKSRPERVMTILVAEDDPDDRYLIGEAFRESDFKHNIEFVENGEELLLYLFALDQYEDRVLPDLVLLDLNMPRIDGRQALAEIKAHPATRRIPVVVFTTSNVDDDIVRTYDLGVSTYITKPSSVDGLREVVDGLSMYWTRMASLAPPT
ncbi:MAG: response regulator [Hyphomicrobiaceae bacterium]